MAKDKAKKPEKTKNTKNTNELQKLMLSSLVAAVLFAAIGFIYLGLYDRPDNSRTTIKAMSENIASTQAAIINQTINQLQVRIKAFADNQVLASALDNNDEAALQRFQNQLANAIPEAMNVRIIALGPTGTSKLSKESAQLRNNIELDLLRRANSAQNELVKPEAYKFQNKWILSLTHPIKTPNQRFTSGALLISFDDQFLANLISSLDAQLGQTVLIQKFQQQQVVTAFGDASGDRNYTVPTNFDFWQVSFTPSKSFVAQNQQDSLLVWILMGVALTGLVITFLAFYKQTLKLITTNLGTLALLETSSGRFTLPGFAEVDVAIKFKVKTLSKQAAQAKPKKEDTEPDSVSAQAMVEEIIDDIPDDIPDSIFRAYDIRGIADQELTDPMVTAIGRAIGSEALDQGQQTVIVAADARHSSPRIKEALIKGLVVSGRDVIDIGSVPTPLMYFATHQLGTQSGVMITGSHNPSEYNGLKVVISGHALSGSGIKALRERIINRNFSEGKGNLQTDNLEDSYVDTIINDVAIAQPLKVVIDAGNGIPGAIAPRLFEELGCEVIPLYCEVDGNFPHHHPDPTVAENLADLITAVKAQEADLGIAFDGDGDRLGVVTATGQIIPADRLLMLLAQDVVSRNPGADILFDVKCTRSLNQLISNYGGRPIMWKTGHSFMKEKMAETGALLGGEFSGHIFFKERWFGFDDGMYAAARLIEILSTTDPDLDLQLQAFPETIGTPELKVQSTDQQKFEVIEALAAQADFGDGKVSTLDGVRVDFSDGWGLVRASNTTPLLILRFEADTEEAMARIKALFKEQLTNISPELSFDF